MLDGLIDVGGSARCWRMAIGAAVLLPVFGWRRDGARAQALGLPMVLAVTARAG